MGSFGQVVKRDNLGVTKIIKLCYPKYVESLKIKDHSDLTEGTTTGSKEIAFYLNMTKKQQSSSFFPTLVSFSVSYYLLRYNKHQTTIGLVDAFTMSYEGKSIFEVITRDKHELNMQEMVKQCFDALGFLRRNRVYHMDISPNNVVYHRTRHSFKLIDFGQAEMSHVAKDLKPFTKDAPVGKRHLFSVQKDHPFLPEGLLVHCSVGADFSAQRLAFEKDTVNLEYRDISKVFDKHQHVHCTSDWYSMACVCLLAMGVIPVNSAEENEYSRKQMLEKNVYVRGPLEYHELLFWQQYICRDPSLLRILENCNKEPCFLMRCAAVFGKKLCSFLGKCLHPIPEFRPTQRFHSETLLSKAGSVNHYGVLGPETFEQVLKCTLFWRTTDLKVGCIIFQKQLTTNGSLNIEFFCLQPLHRTQNVCHYLISSALRNCQHIFSSDVVSKESFTFVFCPQNEDESRLYDIAFGKNSRPLEVGNVHFHIK